MPPEPRPQRWQTILAFAIIYIVWGSTYLAIRIGVQEVPPLLLAAMRFAVAGFAIYAWVIARGEPSPTKREWRSAGILALVFFLLDYGLVFWAEQRVNSGVTAVMLATIPMFMALSEIIILRTQRLTSRLIVALLVGIGGVAVLMTNSLNLGGSPIDKLGAVALIISPITWSIASAFSRKLPLPKSKLMSSGAQMLLGGIFLTIAAAAFGEFQNFHPAVVSRQAWFALAYLIVAGSIIGFTAYVWLLAHESPTRVGTYGYVNPIVAVILGYFVAGEPLTTRTVVGALFVLISVVIITTTPTKKPAPTPELESAPETATS
ncbi:MAG TPA: EamA family transporter [Candidatus Acidoferrales bacterium]